MIIFTQGDTAVLNLTATDGNGNPINLTGASFTTYIKGPNGVISSFGNSQHAIVTAAAGTFILSLAALDTAACGLGANKDILTVVVVGQSTINYRGAGILTVYPPVPLQ